MRPKKEPTVTAEDQILAKTTVEMQALAQIVTALAPLPEPQQQAVLRAVNAYFRDPTSRRRGDDD
jgi:hypothetical protein